MGGADSPGSLGQLRLDLSAAFSGLLICEDDAGATEGLLVRAFLERAHRQPVLRLPDPAVLEGAWMPLRSGNASHAHS